MADRTRKADKLAFVEPIIEAWEASSPAHPRWGSDGFPVLDYDLLGRLMTSPLQDDATANDGTYAGAVEIWVGEELRRLGFERDVVWPRRRAPRVVPPDLAAALDGDGGPLLASSGAAGARIWGAAYEKQVDAGIASSWRSGPEALISVKTQSSSFGKNANNRIEESFGDGANLKRRFPLACLGYILVLRDTILADEPTAFSRYVHTLARFVDGADGYDAVAVMLVHWEDNKRVIVRGRGLPDVPPELSAERFFKTVVETVLARAPLASHGAARAIRRGPDESGEVLL